MVTEAELKLRLAPADHPALRRSQALAAVRPRRVRLSSTYFDTPDCALERHGMVLRLRHAGRRWVQGLKSANVASGGLHVREEWEYSRADPGLDLARFAHTPLADLEDAGTLHARLVPAFRVDVTRTLWTLSPAPGSRLEVVLDAGVVECDGRSEPISEVEIECLEGEAGAAFDLARRLLDDAPLHPSAVTKAERGYRLFRGMRVAPVKARPIVLDRHLAPLGAARRVVAAGLAQLQANEEGLLATADPEFVHQARIALRRMRSALRMFRDHVGEERARGWRDALGEVARALGAARDWDVFAGETFPALAAAHGDAALARRLRTRVARQRSASRAAAREALRSLGFARVALELARWIGTADGDAPAPGAESLEKFAARTLRKRHRRLLRDAADLASLGLEERHRVRIDTKRLRYGTDALASLFKSARVDEYRKCVEALQDALGVANDAATARGLLARLDPPAAFAAFAHGWLAANAAGDAAYLDALIARLSGARHFWAK
jgi:triphosphatase